jgi:hypothetical protein
MHWSLSKDNKDFAKIFQSEDARGWPCGLVVAGTTVLEPAKACKHCFVVYCCPCCTPNNDLQMCTWIRKHVENVKHVMGAVKMMCQSDA